MRKLNPIYLLTLLVCSFAPSHLSADQKPWTEVKSPHFRVLTDGNATDGRRVAREFEQMREVFATAFPKMRLENGAQFVIFAPKDDDCMKTMQPILGKTKETRKEVKKAGLFQSGWERAYAVICLNADAPGRYSVVYHEYVHTLLHANFRWLPTWLDEGLAEFYGNSRFEQTKVYVGTPSSRVFQLRDRQFIPLDELISENPWRKFSRDEEKIDRYYAESWALVHYLFFGPGMENGAKLNQFYQALMKGEKQKDAFEENFGDFKKLQEALTRYINNFSFTSYVFPNPPHIQEKDFPSREMSVAETEAELGTYRAWSYDLDDARDALNAALQADANQPLAHETVGFLEFREGHDDKAKEEFIKAYTADPNRYLSLYYKTMLSGLATATTSAGQGAFRAMMSQVLKLDSNFAPAFVELSFSWAREGDLSNALVAAQRAELLQPNRSGYIVLAGQISLALGHNQDAAKLAQFVADRWGGPDRDEAMDLWNKVPADQRPGGLDAPEDHVLSEDIKTADGTITSTACGDKGQGITVALKDGTETESFHSDHFFMTGFSDTLWYGHDHFSLCHNLEGLRGIVRYRTSGKKDAADPVELEIRVDLPKPADTKTDTPAATGN